MEREESFIKMAAGRNLGNFALNDGTHGESLTTPTAVTHENFQGNHTHGASRGHLCDSSAILSRIAIASMLTTAIPDVFFGEGREFKWIGV